jgi:hypothetical protein
MKLGQEGGVAAAGINPHIISLSRPAANPDFSGVASAFAPQNHVLSRSESRRLVKMPLPFSGIPCRELTLLGPQR